MRVGGFSKSRGRAKPNRARMGRFTGRGRKTLPRKELLTDEQLKELEAESSTIEDAQRTQTLKEWNPKTVAGKLVKNGEITSMEELWTKNLSVLEPEIIDTLVPNLEEKIIDTRKTAYVRAAGRRFNFSAFVLVGDGKNYIGLGLGSDKEKFPAIRKAIRDAKLNIIPVRIGSGSWEDFSDTTRSVPFKVTGKCASVRVTLYSAPKGTGLVVGPQIKDVFRMAGITDVWGQTTGSSDTKFNYVCAAFNALAQLNNVRVSPDIERKFTKVIHASRGGSE